MILLQAGVSQRVGRGIALLFHEHGIEGGEWSEAYPGRNLPPGKTWYQFYRRLGVSEERCELAENLVPTGIGTRTVHAIFTIPTELIAHKTCKE